MQGFRAVLQAPDIPETGIGPADQFAGHHIRHQREIKAAETSRERNAVHAGLRQHIVIFLCPPCINDPVVLHPGALFVHRFGIRGDRIGRHVAHDFEHFLVAVHRVFEIHRRVIVFAFVPEPLFLEVHDLFHQGMVQMKLYIFVV